MPVKVATADHLLCLQSGLYGMSVISMWSVCQGTGWYDDVQQWNEGDC